VAGRYLVASRIGVGGMGEVYRAEDVRLQRPVAIKVLHRSLTNDPDALARFSREAANCSKINNQHVVQVHDFGETEDGLAYIAMELVQGRSLKAVIDSEGPLKPERVAQLVGQIAKGLDAAHRLACPVVHRDLKPENILMAQDPEGGEIAKVADFGISKAMRDESQQVTKTGFVAGTYEFMSPEQVTGGAVDQRSDVYSLGLIAFVMLTGRLPFPAQTPEHSMLMRLNEAPKTLRETRPDIAWPDPVQAVIAKALSRDPSQRYGSAGGFGRALIQAVQPEIAVAASAHRPGRRISMWPAAAVLVLLALGTGVVALISRVREPRDSGLGPVSDTLVSLAERTSGESPPDTVPGSNPPQVSQPSAAAERRNSSQPPSEAAPPSTPRTKSRRTPPPAVQPDRAPAQLPDIQSEATLRRYDSILRPELDRDSALLALRSLNALLPQLQTARDSVEADLYRAEALALSGQPEQACVILDHARPHATELQRRKIELWVDQGLCAAQQSSVFPRRSMKVTAESVRGIRTISNG